MISEDVVNDYDQIDLHVSDIIKAAINNDNRVSVAKLKSLIPEFKSNNSEYEVLDLSGIDDPSITSMEDLH